MTGRIGSGPYERRGHEAISLAHAALNSKSQGCFLARSQMRSLLLAALTMWLLGTRREVRLEH